MSEIDTRMAKLNGLSAEDYLEKLGFIAIDEEDNIVSILTDEEGNSEVILEEDGVKHVVDTLTAVLETFKQRKNNGVVFDDVE